jgi:hypothetical protein
MVQIPPAGVMSRGYSILTRRIPAQIPGAATASGTDDADARWLGVAP